MEPEEDAGTPSQNQNLHDYQLQNYLVTFKSEIEAGDDGLPGMDVDSSDVSDLYSGSANHLQDSADGEGSGQFSSGFYSEQEGMLSTALSDESTQHQIADSTKDGVSGMDLEGVQAQLTHYEDSQMNPALVSGMQGGAGHHQGIIMTSLSDGLDPSTGKMIQLVSLGGEDGGQYLSLADGQQMQILSSEDLGLSTGSLETIDGAVGLNHSSSVASMNTSTPTMALVPMSENTGGNTSAIDMVQDVTKGGTTGGSTAGMFSSGMASLVAVPGAGEGGQPQLFALHRGGLGSEALQMNSMLGADSISQDLACQTITVMPTDLTQNGEMNYVLILSQPDGSKEGVATMAQMAQICDFKQETTEITDTIIDENGETKNVLRLIPKRLVGEVDNQQLVCDYCNYTSPKRYLLTRHMKSHSEERPFKCDACGRGFKTAASLLNHVNTHTGTRPHKCKTCEAAFTTSGELVRHIRYRHTFEKPHRCPECDYASVELSKLKRHMRSHTGERPYKCPSCPYASPDTYKLKRHMRIHTGEKPYECDICHARFTQSNSLKAHKLIHTGNKPIYQCSLCPTTCGRKTDLKIHFNKLHAIGSPLDCKKCGKAFSDRYSYKQHVRSHDLEKCFRCDQCDFMTATEKSLELHVAIHGKKYECDECHLSFILKHLLDKHKAMFHHSGKDFSADGKNVTESNLITVLNRYDLSELQCETDESSLHLLNTPSASDTLHKNLMQDIKEGKLGDVPQVVIVHPDGSQEEISSKLTGDKWSIEELFSTATNNGQTRCGDDLLDKDMTGVAAAAVGQQQAEGGGEEEELCLVDGNENRSSSSSSLPHPHSAVTPLSQSLLSASSSSSTSSLSVDGVRVPPTTASILLVDDGSGGQSQEVCFSNTAVSQLCEASTQAELESDTDSCGETPEQEEAGITSQVSDGKPSNHGERPSPSPLPLPPPPPISGPFKTTPSSSTSTSTTTFDQSSRPDASMTGTAPTSLPYSYLKSLITQKPIILKSSSSSSSTLSSLSSSSSSALLTASSLLLQSFSPNKKATPSVVHVAPSNKTLVNSTTPSNNVNISTKSNPGQQYSLLKNINLNLPLTPQTPSRNNKTAVDSNSSSSDGLSSSKAKDSTTVKLLVSNSSTTGSSDVSAEESRTISSNSNSLLAQIQTSVLHLPLHSSPSQILAEAEEGTPFCQQQQQQQQAFQQQADSNSSASTSCLPSSTCFIDDRHDDDDIPAREHQNEMEEAVSLTPLPEQCNQLLFTSSSNSKSDITRMNGDDKTHHHSDNPIETSMARSCSTVDDDDVTKEIDDVTKEICSSSISSRTPTLASSSCDTPKDISLPSSTIVSSFISSSSLPTAANVNTINDSVASRIIITSPSTNRSATNNSSLLPEQVEDLPLVISLNTTNTACDNGADKQLQKSISSSNPDNDNTPPPPSTAVVIAAIDPVSLDVKMEDDDENNAKSTILLPPSSMNDSDGVNNDITASPPPIFSASTSCENENVHNSGPSSQQRMPRKPQTPQTPQTNAILQAAKPSTGRKGKSGKRHAAETDQSLVVVGKRVRKALLKVSL